MDQEQRIQELENEVRLLNQSLLEAENRIHSLEFKNTSVKQLTAEETKDFVIKILQILLSNVRSRLRELGEDTNE